MRLGGALRRSLFLASLTLVGQQLGAQGSGVTVRPNAPRGGVIAGIVRDTSGAPLEGVRILVESLARQARSSAKGGFVLEGLPAGIHSLRFRKLGYAEAQANLSVIADSAITIAVTMAAVAEQLDAIVIEATVLNQVTGLVTDMSGTPLAGVVVEVLGLNRRLETNSDGRYVLLDLTPGNYMLQFRAPGFKVSQYGLRMVAQIERDITTKLQPASSRDRMSVPVAAAVALEANRRQSLRGAQSMLLGRDELQQFDVAPLGDALRSSRAALLLDRVNASCVLLNGFEPLSTSSASEQRAALTAVQESRRFFGVRDTRFGTNPSADVQARSNARAGGGWLNFFRANEVELLEIYTPGSDNSRTICGRFPPSSGCSCPPEPSAIVIWLRR